VSISQDIAERLALGPDEGQGMRLVESCGVTRGPAHAGRWALQHDPGAAALAREPEYAGRGLHGGLVYLVTYTLREEK
jgi:hypothetical protein